jgi:hypothetical protein
MTTETEEKKAPVQASVHPATLGIRDLVYAGGTTVVGVYGGAEGKVWVATFADHNEAQAFILASNQFKQPVNGYILEDDTPKVIVDGTRVEGRKPTDTLN